MEEVASISGSSFEDSFNLDVIDDCVNCELPIFEQEYIEGLTLECDCCDEKIIHIRCLSAADKKVISMIGAWLCEDCALAVIDCSCFSCDCSLCFPVEESKSESPIKPSEIS